MSGSQEKFPGGELLDRGSDSGLASSGAPDILTPLVGELRRTGQWRLRHEIDTDILMCHPDGGLMGSHEQTVSWPTYGREQITSITSSLGTSAWPVDGEI